jgi:hypothetical protein
MAELKKLTIRKQGPIIVGDLATARKAKRQRTSIPEHNAEVTKR